jgi:hypothetical protein
MYINLLQKHGMPNIFPVSGLGIRETGGKYKKFSFAGNVRIEEPYLLGCKAV